MDLGGERYGPETGEHLWPWSYFSGEHLWPLTITRISPEITFLLFRFYIVLVVAARCIVKLTNHTRYIGDIS